MGMVAEPLKLLEAHPRCKSANYFPSRHCFSVARLGDKARKEFRLKDLKRKRALIAGRDDEEPVQNLFDCAVESAMSPLASEAHVPQADAEAAEEKDEEQQSDSGQE